MLRRRFVLPVTTPRNDSSMAICSGYCSTAASLSAPFCAPAFMWQRRFCSSSSARGIVEFTGNYYDSLGRWQPWSAARENGELKSVSKWGWPFAQQFTDLVHDPTLSLPKADTMLPAMQVFSKLDIDDKILRDWKPPGDDRRVYDHCSIEGAMKANGFMPDLDDARYIAASSAERKLMLDEFKEQRDKVGKILEANQNMVEKLTDVVQLAASDSHPESKMDLCAHACISLCGFDDHQRFRIAAAGSDFKIFGGVCHSDGDFYVVLSAKGDLVLVIEDKAEKKKGEPHDAIIKQGHLGQVVGELLQLLSLNREKSVFRNVFAVRFINYHVTAFRVDPDERTLATLIETRNVPDKKLQLLCSEKNPTVDRGWSLIDKAQRQKALQAMADIRNFVLTQ